MMHIEESAASAAIARIERENEKRCADPGVVGVQARLQVVALRSFYMAVVGEINRGTPSDDLRRAAAAFTGNLLLSVVDTVTSGNEPRRFEEARLIVAEVGFCIGEFINDPQPGRLERVPAATAGRA
jgi:hypothetical protein